MLNLKQSFSLPFSRSFSPFVFLKRSLSLVIGIFSFFTFTIAQSNTGAGTIAGIINDAGTGDTMVGVTLRVEGTTSGAVTDLNGRYTISGVKAGNVNLTISFVGYQTLSIKNIAVQANKVITINASLKEESLDSGVVAVVEAKSVKNSDVTLLKLQQKAISISDGISAEQMKRSPDATSSDALKRVTGVSVFDGKFVFVRGVPERYNAVLLNGAAMSSTEPDKKSFAFDLLPSNLLDNIIVVKSATPDLSGEFSGGLMKLSTVDFPVERTGRLNFSSGYVPNASFKSFGTYSGGKFDGLGFDDGTRALPSSFPQALTGTADALNQAAKSLPNIWQSNMMTAPVNTSGSFSMGNSRKLGSDRSIGYVSSLSYRSAYNCNHLERREFDAQEAPTFDYQGTQFNQAVLWGGLFNVNYKLNNHHEISFRNTYSHSADNTTSELTGNNYTEGTEQMRTALQFVSRTMYSGQVGGEHFIPFVDGSGKKGIQAQWQGYYTRALRDEPDYRRLVYARDIGSEGKYSAVIGPQPSPKYGGRYYSDLADQVLGATANASTMMKDVKFSAGGLHESRHRDFNSRLLGVVNNARGNGITDYTLYTLPADQIFAPENFRENGFSLGEYQNGTNNYTASQQTSAAYIMADAPMQIGGKELRFVGGVRVENAIQAVHTLNFSKTEPIDIRHQNLDVLPSLNLTYRMNDKTNMRLAYSSSVNRPELRELAPFAYYDFNTQYTVYGNPDLKRATIQNIDARFEMYPSAGQLISGSVFYKKFHNAIEQVIAPANPERTFKNADSAETYGFELEGRIGFGFLGTKWATSGLMVNYTYVQSNVEVAATATTVARSGRPLQGQSPYIVNVGLQLVAPKAGTSISVQYNTFGKRVIEAATAYEADVMEMSRNLVDFTLTQPLFSNRYEIKLIAKDLLHEAQIFTQADSKGADRIIRSNSRSSVFTLSLGMKL